MFQHQKPLYTIPEVLELLSHSRGKFYEEVRLGGPAAAPPRGGVDVLLSPPRRLTGISRRNRLSALSLLRREV